MKEDLKFEEKGYRRDSSLFIHRAMSETEYEESARKLLQTRNNVVSFEAQMTSTELSILQNRQQIIELSIQQDDEVLAMEQSINGSKEKLLALIKTGKYQIYWYHLLMVQYLLSENGMKGSSSMLGKHSWQ